MPTAILIRTANRPVLAAVWCLTLFALIPFPSMAYLLLGAAANLGANGLALFLLCSRSRVDRAHGFARLCIQVVILVLGIVAVARSGVSIDGFFHYLTSRTA